MIRAVVDTNLIVSGTASARGTPHDLMEAWRRGLYVLVVSPLMLEEVADVLSRPTIRKHFHLAGDEAASVIRTLTSRAFITAGTIPIEPVSPDPDDDAILAAALEGMATHIVTGDKKHLLNLKTYQGIPIVTARYFLDTVTL